MDNEQIARRLEETADLMEIGGEDAFRILSYRNGASVIETIQERIEDIARNPERKLTEIEGIGKGLAAAIGEIIERGSCERRDFWLGKYPAAALEFRKLSGLGPRSIAVIFEHYRPESIDDLEKLCLEQKLRTLPRMGAKLEEKVLHAIERYRRRDPRYLP